MTQWGPFEVRSAERLRVPGQSPCLGRKQVGKGGIPEEAPATLSPQGQKESFSFLGLSCPLEGLAKLMRQCLLFLGPLLMVDDVITSPEQELTSVLSPFLPATTGWSSLR